MPFLRLHTLQQYQEMGKRGPETKLITEETVVDTAVYRLVMTAKQPDVGPLPPGSYRAVFHAEGQPALDILVAAPGVEVLYQELGKEYPQDLLVFKGRLLKLVEDFPLPEEPTEAQLAHELLCDLRHSPQHLQELHIPKIDLLIPDLSEDGAPLGLAAQLQILLERLGIEIPD